MPTAATIRRKRNRKTRKKEQEAVPPKAKHSTRASRTEGAQQRALEVDPGIQLTWAPPQTASQSETGGFKVTEDTEVMGIHPAQGELMMTPGGKSIENRGSVDNPTPAN